MRTISFKSRSFAATLSVKNDRHLYDIRQVCYFPHSFHPRAWTGGLLTAWLAVSLRVPLEWSVAPNYPFQLTHDDDDHNSRSMSFLCSNCRSAPASWDGSLPLGPASAVAYDTLTVCQTVLLLISSY